MSLDLLSLNRPLVFDGAMGTMLLSSGLSIGECPELWNLTKADVIIEVSESFVKSGANIIQTNTFGANRKKLANYGLGDKVNDINKAAVRNAKKAANSRAKVAVSIGPTGEVLQPWGNFKFDRAVNVFTEQIRAALSEEPDILLIETMSQLAEARAALLAAKSLSNIPVIVTMTFEENGRTTFGSSPEAVAVTLNAMGADVVGVNCVGDFDLLLDIVKRMAHSIGKPVLAQPNAGIPKIIDGKPVYTISPKVFAERALSIIKAGAGLIGGCCGSTPLHISELSKSAKKTPFPIINQSNIIALASNFDALFLDHKGPITFIGEHSNPSSNKVVQKELLAGDFSSVVSKAKKQIEKGAHIIDVNMGVPGEDEASLMKRAVLELQKNTKAILCIDSSDALALEEGLKHFHGRAILNSVDGNEKKLQSFLPIAKKYGAMIIGLALDDRGVETIAKERLEISKKIIRIAKKYNIPKQDIIIDGLTLTVGAQQKFAMEALETIRLVKQELNCLTTLGLSNISHGVPQRHLLNNTFLAMALSYGLDFPMMDPSLECTREIIAAAEFLLGRDVGGKNYVNIFSKKQSKYNNQACKSSTEKNLYNYIIEGDVNLTKRVALNLLKFMEPLNIINDFIVPALTEVGQKYECGDYFLPELLLSAEAAQMAFTTLRESMKDSGLKNSGTIIMATVQGDIHDIGKNITKVLLQNHGFDVIDLGKDVSPEKIVQAASPEVKLIGLSALMTTTVVSMEKTIKLLRESGYSGKIMVGGAVLSQDIATKIGADFYAKDALEGVKIANLIYKD